MGKIDLSSHLSSTKPKTWLFVGDSITQGAKHTRGGRDFSQHFRERLGELGRNEDVVINSGIGGGSFSYFLPRFDERVTRFHPDAIFIMFGTNDAIRGKEGIQQFNNELEEFVAKTRETGIKTIILQTTIPMIPVNPEMSINLAQWADPKLREGKLRGLSTRLANIEEYAEETKIAAVRLNLPIVDNWAAFKSAGLNLGQLMDGGFHPNEFGHILIAHTIFRTCGMWDDSSWVCRLFVPS